MPTCSTYNHPSRLLPQNRRGGLNKIFENTQTRQRPQSVPAVHEEAPAQSTNKTSVVEDVKSASSLAARLRRMIVEEQHRAALAQSLAQEARRVEHNKVVVTMTSAEAIRVREQRMMEHQLEKQKQRIAVLEGKVRGPPAEHVEGYIHDLDEVMLDEARKQSRPRSETYRTPLFNRKEGEKGGRLTNAQLAAAIAFQRARSSALALRKERVQLDSIRREQNAFTLSRNQQWVARERDGDGEKRREEAKLRVVAANVERKKDVMSTLDSAHQIQLQEALREVTSLQRILSSMQIKT